MCGHAIGFVSWGVGDAQKALEGGPEPGVSCVFDRYAHDQFS